MDLWFPDHNLPLLEHKVFWVMRALWRQSEKRWGGGTAGSGLQRAPWSVTHTSRIGMNLRGHLLQPLQTQERSPTSWTLLPQLLLVLLQVGSCLLLPEEAHFSPVWEISRWWEFLSSYVVKFKETECAFRCSVFQLLLSAKPPGVFSETWVFHGATEGLGGLCRQIVGFRL